MANIRNHIDRIKTNQDRVNDIIDSIKSGEKYAKSATAIYGLYLDKRNTEAYKRLYESIKGFTAQVPVANAFFRIYDTHFSILFLAMEAVNKNESRLQKDFELLGKELSKFNSLASEVIGSTRLDSTLYSSGPLFYTGFLQSKSPGIPLEKLVDHTRKVMDTATEIIREIDDLLGYFVKAEHLFSGIYQGLQKEVSSNRKSSNSILRIFANSTYDFNWLEYERTGSEVRGNINRMLENRNRWSGWLGKSRIKQKEYYLKV